MADARKDWSFHGGVHLDDHKAESTGQPVRRLPIPDRLTLPLHQHIGLSAEPVVRVGDLVKKGQLVAQASDYVSASIHAPTSGRVVGIGPQAVPHPSGLYDACIVIESDGKDAWTDLPEPMTDYATLPTADLRERIRWAGIVGLGGAAFPTAVKVNTSGQRPIDTLVINAAECEPYITCDDMLMREQAADVVEGIGILRHLVGARQCLIGIEDNKPEAAEALRQALSTKADTGTEVVVIPTLYPSGGEKQLIRLLTGREVPSHGLPAAVGVLCQNVATAVAVADAVLRGRPLIERVITVTGRGVRQPGNFRVAIGSAADFVIAQSGGYSDAVRQLILGGPMMGFAMQHDQVPVTKATNCLLAAAQDEVPAHPAERPCIRCGECVKVCPAQLLPQQIFWHARAHDFDKAQDYHLFDCIECGCCAYVCPAHIPLVHYYRFAKTEIWAQEREREKSDLARRRHEARVARIERLEQERKARLRQKKEALEQKSGDSAADPKKAAIEAAMRRVAAKKAAQPPEPETPGGE
ncbi:MAG TPA: electron transport complex subunit RsxC [Gammaproteobacteria bacterium]|nr:electron transport complex subunit RsxC [Gammaproteobacteria bacterium]MCP5435700.1 electron transport complex subunit RsxC [Chromatiaceae bacterium]HOP16722.1 electron transport complex subunit RsxC [Gammaproteobacteria bacterium]HPQ24223.1 electron transport complex subunit RsxC [Gammaproteobacteria bacterium]